jgi:hypothetical protein
MPEETHQSQTQEFRLEQGNKSQMSTTKSHGFRIKSQRRNPLLQRVTSSQQRASQQLQRTVRRVARLFWNRSILMEWALIVI